MSHEAKDGRRDRRGRPDFASRGFGVETLERRELLAGNVIGGFVYHDADGNGRFDSGEAPIAGSQIELLNASGAVVGSTTTDASGAYQFSSDRTVQVAPTTLSHKVTFPETPTSFSQSATASQFDPALGTLTSVDLVHTGTLTSRIQVESRDPAPATVVGNVDGTLTTSGPGAGDLVLRPTTTQSFNASAFDGVVDFSGTSGKDFGAVPATDTKAVTLTSPGDLAAFIGTGTVSFTEAAVSNSFASGAGNLVSQVSTSATSTIDVVYHYLPQGDLKPGQYAVVQAVQPAGYGDGIDSRGGVSLPNSTGNDRIPVTLAAADLTSINFGEWLPNGLAGYVYLDADNDGQKDATEFGIATVEMTLRGVADSGEAVKLTTTTDANGYYQFINLLPGQYVLTEAQPKGFLTGLDTIGTQGGKVGSSRFSRIELRSGVVGVGNNFGERARPDCNLGLLLSRVAKGQPLPASIGTNIERYLPGLVAYAQEHPRGPASRADR